MSIKKVEIFTIVCDNCGHQINIGSKYSEEEDESFPNKKDAEDRGWLCYAYFDYCEDCWEYDENDNLIIKTVAYKQKRL